MLPIDLLILKASQKLHRGFLKACQRLSKSCTGFPRLKGFLILKAFFKLLRDCLKVFNMLSNSFLNGLLSKGFV